MATYNRGDRRRVEDWSGVTTSNVIPDGQFRWYDGVTGYNASEVIELVGDGSTTIASLLKRQPATDGAQTLYGVKTFDSIPNLPATAPSSDNQATRKKYVDDQIVGSLGLPAGYLYGLETEADTDTDHDVKINIGKCRDYDDTIDLELTTAMVKRIDATWVAGTTSGGLFTGSVAVDTTYHLFLIMKDSDGSIDAGWDTDIDCANIPTGYTAYRRIRSHVTDSSSNIIDTTQLGNGFRLKSWLQDFNALLTTTAGYIALSVPGSIQVVAEVEVTISTGTTASSYIYSPDDTDQPASAAYTVGLGHVGIEAARQNLHIRTNTSSQVRGVATANNTCVVYLRGWSDDRGQHGGK